MVKEYKEQFTIRITEDTLNKIKVIAEKEKRSTSGQIEYLINVFIKDYEKVHGEIKYSLD